MPESAWEERLRSALAGTYTFERELGGGGMSRVFLATESSLGRQVVIKVLPPQLAEGVSTERFTREIRLAAKLQHPHIVPLLSAGEVNGLPWFAMPFVEGESLRMKLRRSGELPVSDVLRVLREVASALAYAHARGVVHRDIKPENILLSGGTAMVSDFGVAKAIVDAEESTGTGLTSLGVALGTPAYMAPEQGMADPRMDQRADVYAFGVVAYELLAGRTPFQGRSPQATLAAHVTEVPEPVERLRGSTPPALASLVMQCLAKSPADRPQSAQELVNAIDALTTPSGGTAPHIAPSVVTTAQVTSSGTARSGASRKLIALAAGILLLALGSWYASTRLRTPDISERRIAVAPFENLTGDPQFDVVGRMAADWLSQGIARAESVEVVATLAVTSAMADAPRGSNPVPLLARATRASVVITGTIYPQGDSLRLQAAVIDAKTDREILSLDPVSAPKTDPMQAIESLRERLVGAIAVGADTGRNRLMRAPRFSAYQEYLRGEALFARSQAQALPYFERAIGLDSMLVPAYLYAAVVHSNVNRWDSAEVVTLRVARFKDRFTPFEHAMFAWAEANLSGSDERQLTSAQDVVARDSLPGFLYLIGLHANALLKPQVALDALLASDSAMVAVGWWQQVTVLANAYHGLGRHEEELAMLRRRRRQFPSSTTIPSRDLRALGALGRKEEALALTDTLLRGITNYVGDGVVAAIAAGALEFDAHHGDTATAHEMSRRILRWFRSKPNANPGSGRLAQEGRAFLQLGELDSAEFVFRRWAALGGTDVAPHGHLGLVLALKGDSARARAIADSLGTVKRKWLFGLHTHWRAAILGAMAEREAALRLLQQSLVEGQNRSSLHTSLQFRSLRGYPPFEALAAPER